MSKNDKPLRRGWTTGACASAASKSAFNALLTGEFLDPVVVTLPKGRQPSFALTTQSLETDRAMAGITKDAGDDPDVTHLALVQATVSRGAPGSGIVFRAGPGVGTVTLPGLPLPVGEPAINPKPREMISSALTEVGASHGVPTDVVVEISVANGEQLAKKTWNPRLGIVGGISILGTTGVVVPYSCSAWIDSIHRGVDVARANGYRHVAGCTGSTSEAAIQALYGLPDTAMLDMGDFVGGLLKYVKRHPVPRLTIGGGFAKLSKLAQGHFDLHSGRSQVDNDVLARVLANLGASDSLVERARSANTANEVLGLSDRESLPLAASIANQAREQILARLAGDTLVEVIVVDRDGAVVGRSEPDFA